MERIPLVALCTGEAQATSPRSALDCSSIDPRLFLYCTSTGGRFSANTLGHVLPCRGVGRCQGGYSGSGAGVWPAPGASRPRRWSHRHSTTPGRRDAWPTMVLSLVFGLSVLAVSLAGDDRGAYKHWQRVDAGTGAQYAPAVALPATGGFGLCRDPPGRGGRHGEGH